MPPSRREDFRIDPFQIRVPQEELDDLGRRLRSARLPPRTSVAPWSLGTDHDFMQEFLTEWRDKYDWREVEARLNRLPQFTTEIDGFTIHFVYERGSGRSPLPLILTHGWPGSFVEFENVIAPLAHPERFGGNADDSFDVIVPSIPGYGWSSPPSAPITTREVAALWHQLMTETLGYNSYFAQGGDWGSLVASWLGVDHPDAVKAIHINMMGLRPYTGSGSAPIDADEARWLEQARARLRKEGGYQAIQGSKPQTLAYGLNDSPVGLAAWIVEKFHGWSDSSGRPPFTMEQLITNIMIYWLTQSIHTSIWLYTAARLKGGMGLGPREFVGVPTGFLSCPNDLFPPPPDAWIKRTYNLARRTNWTTGGHFAAYERGEALIRDVRDFFAGFRGDLSRH
ncbi:epoxide hydrolase family protein [Bradyrhizobium sp. NP1]|uniref:epoxide hydrolase family protein n=1 Tax=Bradyrhizobium sp. NP1 TaxID=3049772 RepID=UPI0025A554CC|nr:epoxide hydrolase family protein [Bradyrhizobium sp. NP1]WJR75835.1 epoxide hydrolase [Bradyrhizobium sp. NP1]